jgi:hypothetical protein
VVGHVDERAAVGLPVVDRQHHLRPVAPDGGGDVAPQLQPVLQHAVGVVEELDLVHTHHRSAGALFGHAHPGGLLRLHAVDAGLALGGQ